MRRLVRRTALAGGALLACFGSAAHAGLIGVNFTTTDRAPGPDSNLTSGESAGFVVQTGWNNVGVTARPVAPTAITGTAGETATVAVPTATGSWATQNLDGASGTPDARLMD